jgi:phospho-N-acetylmuramoyl-pentapeptide-transferase
MLYHLLVPLSETIPGANVFRYQSFRTAWAIITALAVAYALFPSFINYMKKLKMEQIIREDGPASHRLDKLGTPTMGGVCILVGIAVSTLLWARLDNPYVWMALVVTVGYGLIGFVDDYKKVIEKSPDGLAGRWKILGQVLFGGGVLAFGHWSGAIEPVIGLPFLKDTVIDFRALEYPAALASIVAPMGLAGNFGWLYPVFGVFVLAAVSNGVNLTDGLDGLAIGPVMTSAATYGVLAYVTGNSRYAEYLDISYVNGAGELTVACMAIVGAGLGFLWYNAYPAQVFMGDVGSLALGGLLGILAICTKHEMLFVLVGGIFVVENLSVIIQVLSFKLTGKRVFAMAPLHHHYEKQGWSEPKIIVRFWIISVVLALVGLSTLKLR